MRLPDSFYAYKELATWVTDTKTTKQLLIDTGAQCIIDGHIYEINAKHLAAGAYQITVKKKEYK